MRRRVRNNGFCTNVVASFFGSFEPCGPQPWPAEARKHPAVARRAPQAAPEIIHNAFSCKTFARAGCGGRAFSASRPRAQGLPYQKEPAGYACHNCELCILHFELFPAPRQTGISNWRQRGEVKGKDRCSERPWLAEINTGFSRASRSPALRRLAKLAPRTSARKLLRHRYQNR